MLGLVRVRAERPLESRAAEEPVRASLGKLLEAMLLSATALVIVPLLPAVKTPTVATGPPRRLAAQVSRQGVSPERPKAYVPARGAEVCARNWPVPRVPMRLALSSLSRLPWTDAVAGGCGALTVMA